jgi:hypothetical protein
MQQVNITQVNPQDFEYQVYSPSDTSVIASAELTESFDSTVDYVEFFVYDYNQNLEYASRGDSFKGYSILDNNLVLDPEQDLKEAGFLEGQYYTSYNFLTNLIGSSVDNTFFITEISSDRTEIRLDTNLIDQTTLNAGVTDLISKINNSNYYYDFLLNFGNNELVIATNILADNTDPLNPTVLIKLYDPLPAKYTNLATLWIVDSIAEPLAYSIELTTVFETATQGIRLRGPNTNLQVTNQQGNSTTVATAETLLQTNSYLGTGSLQYKLNNLLESKGITLNIDYSDYENFVFFSSAQTRLENFYYKLGLLEQYQASANLGTNNNTYVSASQAIWQAKINDVITNFDGYEYYLYYNSSSTTWPKSNTEPPYTNLPTTGATAQTWLTNQLVTASNYDELNKDALVYAIPSYLREDPNNQQLQFFIEMLGQHFDIIWTYTKDVTNKFNADNRIDHGVSKDLIADVLRDLGIKIYQNNFSTQNLYSALLGITPQGSLLNIPDATLTLPATTGFEYITSYVTASSTSSLVPLDDANKEIYKRIYHNLPYILKKKGTVAGLRALINLYGVPDTVLRINEFGGQDKVNVDDWDNLQNTFNYSLQSVTPQGGVQGIAPWRNLTTTQKVPQTIEFRFKATKFPPTYYTSSLAVFVSSSNAQYIGQGFIVEYTGSGYTTGSYSGSTYDPYYQYATLKYVSGSVSASTYLPIYNGGWWTVGLSIVSQSGAQYTASLYVKQKSDYEGDYRIRYEGTSSVYLNTPPSHSSFLYIPDAPNIISPFTYGGGKQAIAIQSASFQELRYFSQPLSESTFDNHVMNPNSIQRDLTAYNTLLYRIQMGTDLNQYYPIITSSHPAVTGSTPTRSFADGYSQTYTIYVPDAVGDVTDLYKENTEYIYQVQPNAGIQIATSDKVRIGSQIFPAGDVLSPYISIEQKLAISQSYTRDVNYVEVAFSPQDEINDDIIDQLGYFNFGEYIGDPRFQSSSLSYYPDLNTLSTNYFKKYTKNYNITDYVRLIKFFDNSLFKMIKDFVPARTGLATGVVIKQHILERNRYRTPQADWQDQTYTASFTSLSSGYATGSRLYTFSGSTGGTVPQLTSYTSSGYYPPFINISQSWSETVVTPSGSNVIIHNNLEEFYTGEFKGTTITATTQSLLDGYCQQFLDVIVTETDYKPVLYKYNITSESLFLSTVTPKSGEISFFYTEEQVEQGSADGALQQQNRGQIANTL